MYRDIPEDFIGSKIISAQISDDKQCLLLNTNKGEFQIITEGDCCSQSWFEHCQESAVLVGNIISNIEFIFLEDMEELLPTQTENYEDCIKLYSVSIVTPNGVCKLEMRNSSNGYYGGEIYVEKVQRTNLHGYQDVTNQPVFKPLTNF